MSIQSYIICLLQKISIPMYNSNIISTILFEVVKWLILHTHWTIHHFMGLQLESISTTPSWILFASAPILLTFTNGSLYVASGVQLFTNHSQLFSSQNFQLYKRHTCYFPPTNKPLDYFASYKFQIFNATKL